MKQCLIFTQDIKTTAYEVKIIGFVFGFIEGQKADLKKSDSFSIELEGKIRYDLYLFNYININLNIDGKRGFGVLGLLLMGRRWAAESRRALLPALLSLGGGTSTERYREIGIYHSVSIVG